MLELNIPTSLITAPDHRIVEVLRFFVAALARNNLDHFARCGFRQRAALARMVCLDLEQTDDSPMTTESNKQNRAPSSWNEQSMQALNVGHLSHVPKMRPLHRKCERLT